MSPDPDPVVTTPSGGLAVVRRTGWRLSIGMLLLLLAFATTSLFAGREASEMQWTLHSRDVLAANRLVLAACLNVETSVRGYQITGDADYLQPYRQDRGSVDGLVARLQDMTRDNPSQQVMVAQEVQPPVHDFLKLIDTLAIGRDDAQHSTLSASKTAMDSVRMALDRCQTDEDRLLNERLARLRAYQSFTFAGTVGLVLLGAFFVGLSVQTLRSHLRAEARRAELMGRWNAQLQGEIEQRKATEAKLLETGRRLERSNEDLSQFAYVASHDLQEPLRAVAGFVKLTRDRIDDHLDDETGRWMDYAMDGAQRMRSLINDLLAFSRVDSRGRPFAPVALDRVLERVVGDLGPAIEASGGKVVCGPLPSVQGDEGQLGQVFQNLLANALKFRQPGRNPEVSVTAQAEHGQWRLEVRDNGIGFEAEHATRIFVIFQRLYTRTEYDGTGIGLAIAKKIVERHGGTIVATSQPGVGSTFTVTLPKDERVD